MNDTNQQVEKELQSRMQLIEEEAKKQLKFYLDTRRLEQKSIIYLEIENSVLKEELRGLEDHLICTKKSYTSLVDSLQKELIQCKERETHLQEQLQQKMETINTLFKENCLLESKISK